MELLAVEEDPVLALPVVAEPLAVVREEDDQARIVEAPRLQPVEEPPDDRVGRGDLAVVGVRVPALERLGRVVGAVGLEEVEEGEDGKPVWPPQPASTGSPPSRRPERWTLPIGPPIDRLDRVVQKSKPRETPLPPFRTMLETAPPVA